MVSVSNYILEVGRIWHAIDVSAPPRSMKTQLGHLDRSNSG